LQKDRGHTSNKKKHEKQTRHTESEVWVGVKSQFESEMIQHFQQNYLNLVSVISDILWWVVHVP